MPDARHPDVGALLPALVRDAGLEVVDAWAEAPAGVGPGPVARYLESLTGRRPRRRPGGPAAAGDGHRSPRLNEPEAVAEQGTLRASRVASRDDAHRSRPRRRRRRGRPGPTPGRPGLRRRARAAAASMPTRWSPTTWPTPRPRWPRPGPRSIRRPGDVEAAHRRRLRGRRRGRPGRAGWPAARRSGASRPAGTRRRPPSSADQRDPAVLAGLADHRGPAPPGRGLRAGARDVPPLRRGQGAAPRRARPPRPTATSPRRSSRAWPSSAASGSRCPRSTAASPAGGESDYMGMVVATEELSWGSLGVGGSLITRPEILTRALVYGGTEEQKKHWLPKLASAEILAAVAVTEPDFGSDVAGIVTVGHAGRGRLGDQRRQDLVHLRRPGRRAHAAGPHRPRPLAGPPGPLDVRRREAPGRRPRLRLHPGRTGRTARPTWTGPPRGAADRHARLPGHALLRAGVRELVRARGQPRRRRRGAGQGLLPPDAGLRERPAADGGAGARRHAGGLRGGRGLRGGAQGVRVADRRLPADPGQARSHGRASSRPPARARTTWRG